ncbi:MAG: acyl carrier protein [Lachnospiraceae bacterium]|nr:acyl carrier protein [Lachnospiraceae bacterium]
MEELMEILEEIRPDVDFEQEETLVDDKILSSFDILSIISEISDAFDITLTPAEIIPANFNSAEALWNMISQLKA